MVGQNTRRWLLRILINCLPVVLCSIIVAISITEAASILAERPVQSMFSESISAGNGAESQLMELDELMAYLSLYPDIGETLEGDSLDDYEKTVEQRRTNLQENILNGTWPAFPYVQLNDRLYFNKKAVNEWFYEQGKQQRIVP